MASIVWTREMSVGVPELDDDHKGLLAVINELEVHTTSDASEEVVRRSLNWLLRYAQTHFAREQAVMRSCKFPMLSEHIEEHRDFINRMQETLASIDENKALAEAEAGEVLVTYLEKWWRNHILAEDMKYKRFAEQNLFRSSRAARDVRGYEIWWG